MVYPGLSKFGSILHVKPPRFTEDHNILIAYTQEIDLTNVGPYRLHVRKCVLSQTDPEPMQVSPDLSHWVSNGDKFGFSNYISNGTIFIPAPTSDYNGTWDVGALSSCVLK